MTKAQHTPTPWRYFSDFDATDLMDKDGNHIARMERMDGQEEHDAAFIVRACNAHDALVEALEKIAALLVIAQEYSGSAENALHLAENALKLAKEG